MAGQNDIANNMTDIDSLVFDAKNDEAQVNKLIDDNKSYIASRIRRFAPNVTPVDFDELMSVGLMAFYEAVKTFEKGKGHFYSFADIVIRRRVIDEFRRRQKDIGTITVLDEVPDDADQSAIIQNASMDKYEKEAANDVLKLEIEQLTESLRKWKITFEDLTKHSPKHTELKATYKDIILKIINDEEVLDAIFRKKYFPIKKIHSLTGISQKKLERSRIYVIAIISIVKGNYEYLSEYVDIPGIKDIVKNGEVV